MERDGDMEGHERWREMREMERYGEMERDGEMRDGER